MTKEQFIQWAISKGWTQDNYGHLQKLHVSGIKTRFKIQANSIRYERKMCYDGYTFEWQRIRSGYFKDLSINNEGKLVGLK